MNFLNFFKTKKIIDQNIQLFESVNEGVNKHLTHLEELILISGKEGGQQIINFVKEMLDILRGHSSSRFNTSVKWDGAPAVIVGRDPLGKFFVASKHGAFSQGIPKLNYSVRDILTNHDDSPGLADKLIKVFNVFKEANVDGTYQGDLIFFKGLLDKYTIDGEKYIGFKPNTLLYTMKADSDEARKILRIVNSNGVGIVFHTKYDTYLEQIKNQEGADVSVVRFKNTQPITSVENIVADNAYILDANFNNEAGTISLTSDETNFISRELEYLEHLLRTTNFKKLDPSALNFKNPNKNILSTLNIFINSLIKSERFIDDIESTYEDYKSWLSERLDTDIENRARKETKIQEKQSILQNLNSAEQSIKRVLEFTKKCKPIKDIFLSKYNNILKGAAIGQYAIEPNGDIRVTSPEGFVVFDQDQNGIKLVDRLEFSRINFNTPKIWADIPTDDYNTAKQDLETKQESFSFKEYFRERLYLENSTDVIVLWPGGFKPPHKGHFAALKLAIEESNANHAIVFIGPLMREGVNITPQQSKAIWDIYFKYLPGVICESIISPINPVKPVYDYVDSHLEDYSNIVVAAGAKEDDIKRYDGFKKKEKYNKVIVKPITIQGEGISGTLTRQKLSSGNIDDALNYFLPEEVKNNSEDVGAIKNILNIY